MICLIPISYDSFSLNFAFLITPLFLFPKKIYYPLKIFSIYIITLVLIFIVSSVYQLNFIELIGRRTISFLISISVFVFCFFKIEKIHIVSFLNGILLFSLLYSLYLIYNLLSLNLINDPFLAKSLIGSQRMGFIFMIGLAVSFREFFLNKKYKFLIISGIIIFGLILTFSRSSYIALLFFILLLFLRNLSFSFQKIKKFVSFFILILAFSYLTFIFFPSFSQFVEQRLINLLLSGEILENLENYSSSEGQRILIWSKIVQYVISNPLTGTGFLGTWVILGDVNEGFEFLGSAHSEYLDQFLRTGLIAFSIYLVIIFKILKYLLDKDYFLFCGFFSVLVYGIFHETFREPSGALVLSIFIGLYSHRLLSQSEDRRLR